MSPRWHSVLLRTPRGEIRALLPVLVRFGSKTVFTALKRDFRYTPESGLKSVIPGCLKRAQQQTWRGLLDQFVGAHEY
jgi:hypothetical protein